MSRLRSWLRWERLQSEALRGLLALLVGNLVATLVGLTIDPAGASSAALTELLFLGVAAYLVTYIGLTLVAFTRPRWETVERWARRRTRAHWITRVVTSSEPGPGVAVAVSALALVVAVYWLPSQEGTGAFGAQVRVVLTALLVALAWLTVATTYAVAYLLQDIRSGRTALAFPGESRGSFTDYLYLSLAVSSTFGTTDVEVLRPRMRRLVAGHGVVAFVFNTVILAAVVSFLVAQR